MRETKAEWRERMVREQRQWIEEHGGTLAGYVARYGSKDDATHYGNGGEAIYQADMSALRDLERGTAYEFEVYDRGDIGITSVTRSFDGSAAYCDDRARSFARTLLESDERAAVVTVHLIPLRWNALNGEARLDYGRREPVLYRGLPFVARRAS